MAATALGLMTLYLLMSQNAKSATKSRFRESGIVPDVISTAPSIAAEVDPDNNRNMPFFFHGE